MLVGYLQVQVNKNNKINTQGTTPSRRKKTAAGRPPTQTHNAQTRGRKAKVIKPNTPNPQGAGTNPKATRVTRSSAKRLHSISANIAKNTPIAKSHSRNMM